MSTARHRRRAAPPGKLPLTIELALDSAAFDPRIRSLDDLQAAVARIAPQDAAARPLDEAAVCSDRDARVKLLAERVRRGLATFHASDVVHLPRSVPQAGQRRCRKRPRKGSPA